jgi:fumarate reductase flavoprotein subunit
VWIDVSHLGAALVEENFRGMVRRCRDFGRDLARVPIEVGPTAHFMMGGVVIDARCRTAIDGLFAAGEDTGGVHGANRLGGNGVAESTVFGGIAGDAMAAWVGGRPRPRVATSALAEAAARLSAPLGRAGHANLYHLQRALRETMWDRVGLVRDGPGLRAALGEIDGIARALGDAGVDGGRAFNTAWQDWLNLGNQVAVARLIALSALAREESRGAHHRRDAPAPAESLYTVRVRRRGEETALWTEPVSLTRLAPPPVPAPDRITVEIGD